MKNSSWTRLALAAASVALVAGLTSAQEIKPADAGKALGGTQGGGKQDSRAVKPCQEEIRKKAKAEHAGASINFESVETTPHSADVVGVKGKFNLRKGADAATMNYTCRVDVKEMKVKRAEYAKED